MPTQTTLRAAFASATLLSLAACDRGTETSAQSEPPSQPETASEIAVKPTPVIETGELTEEPSLQTVPAHISDPVPAPVAKESIEVTGALPETPSENFTFAEKVTTIETGEAPEGTIIESVLTPEPELDPQVWRECLIELASLNADLGKIEKLASDSILPPREEIESTFGVYLSRFEKLRNRELPTEQKQQLRQSLQSTAAGSLERINASLKARNANHLTEAIDTEIASLMESLSSF